MPSATGVEIVDLIREQTEKNLVPGERCHVFGDPAPASQILVGPLWDLDDQEVVMALVQPDDALLLLYPLTGTWNEQLEAYRVRSRG